MLAFDIGNCHSFMSILPCFINVALPCHVIQAHNIYVFASPDFSSVNIFIDRCNQKKQFLY